MDEEVKKLQSSPIRAHLNRPLSWAKKANHKQLESKQTQVF